MIVTHDGVEIAGIVGGAEARENIAQRGNIFRRTSEAPSRCSLQNAGEQDNKCKYAGAGELFGQGNNLRSLEPGRS